MISIITPFGFPSLKTHTSHLGLGESIFYLNPLWRSEFPSFLSVLDLIHFF